MNEILVSIVIPAFRCARYLRQALDSALAQDVPEEILIIDDCSDDGLEEIVGAYCGYPQIRYIRNEQNLGVAESRNRGVALARGTYIAFLDADDIWTPDKLKKQLSRIRETGTVMCSTARELMNPNGTLTGYVIPVPEAYSFRDLLTENLVNCSSVLIRTDVAREFPMRHDDAHEDSLTWLQVLRKYGQGCAVNEPLLKYRITNSGKSGSKLKSAKMTFQTYRYMGFGFFRSCLYFTGYVFHGMKKYFLWYLK